MKEQTWMVTHGPADARRTDSMRVWHVCDGVYAAAVMVDGVGASVTSGSARGAARATARHARLIDPVVSGPVVPAGAES